MGCFALVGLVFSIVAGTYIYHTFVGDYVFVAYPLIMLIVHAILFCSSCYTAFVSIKKIVQEKPEKLWSNSFKYKLKTFFVALLLIFGMEKLGSVVLLPLIWSSYDSIYVLPLYIQLLMPMALFVIYMILNHWKSSDKLSLILYGSVLAYSVFSLLYMIIAAHNSYPTFVNPLSPILQLERLIKIPVGFVILYLVSILVALTHFVKTLIKVTKKS